MINKVINTIKKYNMINVGEKIIVGVSGGADSVALFCVLTEIKKNFDLSLVVVHVNHGVRGEDAYNDSQYVKELCKKYDVPFELYECNIKEEAKRLKMSEEEVGRFIRYREFNNALQKYNAQKIAVAHNVNDSVETVIMRLCRGTGLKGLTGIMPVRDNIIRPLIECERFEIEKYLFERNTPFKNDYTNEIDIYTRNKIRLNILPILKKEINENSVANIFRTSLLLSEEEEYLEKTAEEFFNENSKVLNEKIVFSSEKLSNLDNAVLRRVIRHSVRIINGSVKDISLTNINDCIKIIRYGSNGKSVELLNNISVRKLYDETEFFCKKNVINTRKFCYDINIEKRVFVQELNKNFLLTRNKAFLGLKYVYAFDFDKTDKAIKLRSRETGDKIFFSSINGNKKIKDFFIDKKIPKDKRDGIPLLCCGNNVIFIFDDIYSDYYKVTDNTKDAIYLYLWEEEDERQN